MKPSIAFDVVAGADVVDTDHRHDLFQLPPHLVEHAVVAPQHEGHP
jgi:hypothetical protein